MYFSLHLKKDADFPTFGQHDCVILVLGEWVIRLKSTTVASQLLALLVEQLLVMWTDKLVHPWETVVTWGTEHLINSPPTLSLKSHICLQLNFPIDWPTDNLIFAQALVLGLHSEGRVVYSNPRPPRRDLVHEIFLPMPRSYTPLNRLWVFASSVNTDVFDSRASKLSVVL